MKPKNGTDNSGFFENSLQMLSSKTDPTVTPLLIAPLNMSSSKASDNRLNAQAFNMRDRKQKLPKLRMPKPDVFSAALARHYTTSKRVKPPPVLAAVKDIVKKLKADHKRKKAK
jgi:hypothetical protein